MCAIVTLSPRAHAETQWPIAQSPTRLAHDPRFERPRQSVRRLAARPLARKRSRYEQLEKTAAARLAKVLWAPAAREDLERLNLDECDFGPSEAQAFFGALPEVGLPLCFACPPTMRLGLLHGPRELAEKVMKSFSGNVVENMF